MILAEAAARPAGTFAEAAVRLAGLSGVLFGWTPDAFWRVTPAELRAPTEMLAGALAGTLAGTLIGMRARPPTARRWPG